MKLSKVATKSASSPIQMPPMYAGGNVYQRELKYLQGKGYGWEKVDGHWRVICIR
jgi:hypothetical protein